MAEGWLDALIKDVKRAKRAVRKERRRLAPKNPIPQWKREADKERTRNQFPWMKEIKARRKARAARSAAQRATRCTAQEKRMTRNDRHP